MWLDNKATNIPGGRTNISKVIFRINLKEETDPISSGWTKTRLAKPPAMFAQDLVTINN